MIEFVDRLMYLRDIQNGFLLVIEQEPEYINFRQRSIRTDIAYFYIVS